MAYPKRTPSNNYLPFYLFTVFSLDLHHDKIFQWLPLSTEPSPDCKVYLCTVLNPPCAALYLAALPVPCWPWPPPALAPCATCPSPGQERSAGGQGPSCSWSQGMERGRHPAGMSLPGRAGLPAAAAGRDCRAAERNQSREETNNLLWPLRRCCRSSAALLQALCVSLWSRWPLGKDESLKRSCQPGAAFPAGRGYFRG